MAEEKFTRCPGCNTIFRVTAPQLELRAGQVRCGHCHTVFDGVASLVSL
ncbi:MAG: zinc-ribbon domain-containing protein, partial [Pseudomonadota bacterium]|nr:zinc-ribbon domain-containing protein [Pseudomonadota bacterium]